MLQIKNRGVIPQKYSIEDFADQIKQFLNTSIMIQFNFELAVAMSGPEHVHTIPEAPRQMESMFNVIDELIQQTLGQRKFNTLVKMINAKRMSLTGFEVNDEDDMAIIRIKDHDLNITKMIAEFQLKRIFNPLMSQVAVQIFGDFNFSPSLITCEALKFSNVSPLVSRISKHSNILYNFGPTSEKVASKNLRKGDKLYDILNQCFSCIMDFNQPTKCPENTIYPMLTELPS